MTHLLPLGQEGQVHLAIAVHILGLDDAHVLCGSDKHKRPYLRVFGPHPDGDGNIIHLACTYMDHVYETVAQELHLLSRIQYMHYIWIPQIKKKLKQSAIFFVTKKFTKVLKEKCYVKM